MNHSLWAAFARAFEALSPVFLAVVLSWLAIRIAVLINARVKGEKVRSVLHRLDDAVMSSLALRR